MDTSGLLRVRPAYGLAWACALLVLLGQLVLSGGPVTRLDRSVERFLVPHRANVGVAVAKQVTWLGNPALMVPLLVALVVAVGVRRRSLRVPVRSAALLVALGLSVLVLKGVVGRPAPHGATTHGGAWPSGHSATATVVWGAAVRALELRGRVALAVQGIALPVGVCLVLGGYHQVSDVLAGWALGAALLLAGDLIGAGAG